MPRQGVEGICNFVRISDSVGTAGQPSPHQFADIKAAGYQVVINLAMPDSTNALPNESELVAEQGLDYVHIPVVWEKPTAEDLEQFFETMDRLQDRQVFVHCAKNMRVSVFVFLYRVIHQRVPLEVARQAIDGIWEPNEVWEDFMCQALSSYGVDD